MGVLEFLEGFLGFVMLMVGFSVQYSGVLVKGEIGEDPHVATDQGVQDNVFKTVSCFWSLWTPFDFQLYACDGATFFYRDSDAYS